jgi:hypothetical protein
MGMDKIAQETIDGIKKAQGDARNHLAKAATVTLGNNLVPYDLQAPAKNLYPVNTPIRNRLKRRPGVGKATEWKVIKGIIGSGFDAMGWVAEGQRAGGISLLTEDKSSGFRTLGEEASVTFEAQNAGLGFEDQKAANTVRLLQKLMMKEENAVLGGNASVALGTTPTPTLSAAGTGNSLPAATYSVIVVAMTYEGFRNYTTIANGLTQQKTITGRDGKTFQLSGGYGQPSAAATQAVTSGQALTATVAAVRGALAYAWFVGTAGNEKLQRVTTVNRAVFSTGLETTGQAASALLGADHSRNAALGFDGLLYSAFAADSSAYVKTLGTGATLTSSGRGSIVEIDEALYTMWTNYQISPTEMYVSAQELKSITDKVLGSAGSPLVRFVMDTSNPNLIMAGAVVAIYFNPYSTNGGVQIPIKLHPTLTPGTIYGWADNLPVQYQSPEIPDVAEVITRQDYYGIDWPQTTREHESGVYTEETVAVYAPFGEMIITNISEG